MMFNPLVGLGVQQSPPMFLAPQQNASWGVQQDSSLMWGLLAIVLLGGNKGLFGGGTPTQTDFRDIGREVETPGRTNNTRPARRTVERTREVDTTAAKDRAQAALTRFGGELTDQDFNQGLNFLTTVNGVEYDHHSQLANMFYGKVFGLNNARDINLATKLNTQQFFQRYKDTFTDADGNLMDWDMAYLKEQAQREGVTFVPGKDLENREATEKTGLNWHLAPYFYTRAHALFKEADRLEADAGHDSDAEALVSQMRSKATHFLRFGVHTHSPIVLDQDGNGRIDLTSVEDGVLFDIDGDGDKEQVAWTQVKGAGGEDTDAWLTLDRDGDGQITSGKELFGNQHGAANGYDELTKLDDNGDGVIDAQDAVYGQLKMWQDRNGDGVSQADEMMSLQDAGVESVSLQYTESDETDAFGNELRQQATFTRTDLKAQLLADKWGINAEDAKEGLAIDAWLVTNQLA